MLISEILSDLKNRKLDAQKLTDFFRENLENEPDEEALFSFLNEFKGIEDPELIASFIEAEVKTGIEIKWSDNSRPVIDKHSTGGVGDKISLIVVPWIASAGFKVAKLSGRALGHTGGTIDKLESIPGINTSLSSEKFVQLVNQTGCVIAEPSNDVCPIESVLYDIRDRKGLIPYVPLVTASILSKKIAAGADIFVFDVKVGRGAFFKSLNEARKLANMLLKVLQIFDKKGVAVLTSMENPLGQAVGNSLEVIEAYRFLSGADIKGVNEVAYSVAVNALVLAGFDEEEAFLKLDSSRRSGKAKKQFLKMIGSLGGPSDEQEFLKSIPRAKVVASLTSDSKGFIHGINPLAISKAITAASGGTRRADTGIILSVSKGDQVNTDDELCEIHASDYDSLDRAIDILEDAFEIYSHKPKPEEYVIEVITQD